MGGGGQRIDGGGGAGGGGEDAGVSYRGCTNGTAYDRVWIVKHDTTRDLCFNLVLVSPPIEAVPPGLTLPPRFGLDGANEGPGPFCPAQGGMETLATQVSGTVEAGDAGLRVTHVDVDVTLAFPTNDAGVPATERLQVHGLEVQPSDGSQCPTPLAR